MNLAYRLVAISDASRALKGGQSRYPDSSDIELNKDNGTWIGRGVGPEDFRIPVGLVQYSTRHCYLSYDDCQSSSWTVVDHSTNGTFVKPPLATGWQRLKKGEPTQLSVGTELRLSAPQKESEPLHYMLESYVPETVQVGSAESKGQTVVSAKRARIAPVQGGDEGAKFTPHKLAHEPISQLVELRKNNEALREQLTNERERNESLTIELAQEKSRVTMLEEELSTVKQELIEQKEQRQSIESSAQETKQRSEELQEQVKSLMDEVESLKAEKVDLEKNRDELQACIQSLQANLSVAEKELNTVQERNLEVENALAMEQEARALEQQGVAESKQREAEFQSIADIATATISELGSKVKDLEAKLQLEKSRVEEFKLVEEGAKHWKDTVNSVIGQMAKFMDTMAKRSKSRAELAMKDCEEIDLIRREICELKDYKDEILLGTNEVEVPQSLLAGRARPGDDNKNNNRDDDIDQVPEDDPEPNAYMEDTQNQEAIAANNDEVLGAPILGERNGNSNYNNSPSCERDHQTPQGLGGMSQPDMDCSGAVNACPCEKIKRSQEDERCQMQENNLCGSQIVSDS